MRTVPLASLQGGEGQGPKITKPQSKSSHRNMLGILETFNKILPEDKNRRRLWRKPWKELPGAEQEKARKELSQGKWKKGIPARKRALWVTPG